MATQPAIRSNATGDGRAPGEPDGEEASETHIGGVPMKEFGMPVLLTLLVVVILVIVGELMLRHAGTSLF
jgi:hypothetical protein